MSFIPTEKQWKKWSLPSQVSYIGFVLALAGIPLWIVSYFWPRAPDDLSAQPQLSLRPTAKPYLRVSRIPGSGIEFSYELCFKNSGKNPAGDIKYLKTTQSLQIRGERPIVVNNRPSPSAPSRLVSGDHFCQVFTMHNPVEDTAQIEKLVDRYNAGDVAILLELELTYVDAFTGKEYAFEERNRVNRDRIEIQ